MMKKKRNRGDQFSRKTFVNKAVFALSASQYLKALKDSMIY